jgi:hypothetical protein
MIEEQKDVLIANLVNKLEKIQPGAGKSLMDEIKFINFITEDEYSKITPGMKNHDGTKGPKISVDTIKNVISKTNGAWLNMEPFYNEWALYLTINHLMSTNSKLIYEVSNKTGIPSILICYDLACGLLKDKNKPKWLREHFDLD